VPLCCCSEEKTHDEALKFELKAKDGNEALLDQPIFVDLGLGKLKELSKRSNQISFYINNYVKSMLIGRNVKI